MRVLVPILTLLLIPIPGERGTLVQAPAAVPIAQSSPSSPAQHVDFDTQVRPLLETKCMPCHFKGGTMYVKLPFDRAETIRTLGEKLFTRIQEPSQQGLVREFLAQPAGQ